MIHTSQSIEEYTYELVLQSAINVRGGIYRQGERPLNSSKEDVVISFLDADADQIQRGNIIVSVFVPKLYGSDGVKYDDKERCKVLEYRLVQLVDFLNRRGEVRFSMQSAPRTLIEPTTKQTFVSVNYVFKLLTE